MAQLFKRFRPFHASLPNDENRAERNKQLSDKKTEFEYDFDLLSSLPMVRDFSTFPAFKWLRGVARLGIKLQRNTFQVRRKQRHGGEEILDNSDAHEEMLQNNDDGDNSDAITSMLTGVFEVLDKGRIEGNLCENLQAYEDIFQNIDLPEISKNFLDDDLEFAWMRVAGSNPLVIKKYPSEENILLNKSYYQSVFPVTDEHYKSIPGLENDSLSKAFEDDRLYILDYIDLADVKAGITHGKQKYIYAPFVLFALPTKESKNLVPIAIQCGQDPITNPIVTPNSGEWAWRIAKTIVEIADANHHELISHLGLTHLLIEPFAIATERQLAKDHPLGLLLRPHFEGTFFINDRAAKQLIGKKDQPVDELLAGTLTDSQQLAINAIQSVIFDEYLLPDTLQKREMELLPEYPYRDDALIIWNAIKEWVGDYLSIYYRNPVDDIKNDTELQLWAGELVYFTGGRLKGIGKREGQLGQIENLDYLIEIVTQIVFTASAQHAAVNFSQPALMSYAPAMPMAGYAPVPTDFTKVTERDFLNLLPPIKQAQGQLNLTVLLGSVYYTQLGNYTTLEDSEIDISLKKFQNNLKEIEKAIEGKNKDRRQPYEFLMPSKIPQSINI
jgi:arachidonate 15-lipoxygenase